MKQGLNRFFLICGIVFTSLQFAQATHVIGGNLNYRCISPNLYEITVDFAVDCLGGDIEAIGLDSFATVKIFDGNFVLQSVLGNNGSLTIPFQDVIRLGDPNVACRVLDDPVCVQRQRYVAEVFLPFNPDGYILSFRRCCRNVTLDNVNQGDEVGSTYWIEMTPEALNVCNNSATFKQWADVYVCTDEDIIFDASANDLDGDSLVYKLCVPTEGGSKDVSLSTANYTPPFENINFAPGYSLDNQLGFGTPLTIDPQTGILTVNAAQVGQYIVGICVEEYRNGVKISETRRDFQYNARVCTEPPTAAFVVDSNPQCDGLTVDFNNMSSSTQNNPLQHEWFFIFPDGGAISTDENPQFTYPAPGLYQVALVTFDGVCQDTAFLELGVSDMSDPNINFSLSANGCSDGEIEVTLENMTTAQQEITAYNWTVVTTNDTQVYNTENVPPFTVIGNQTVEVILDVTGISGCTNTLTQALAVEGFPDPILDPLISSATLALCVNSSITLNPVSNPNYSYSWTSSDPNVSFDQNAPSPVVMITQETSFSVIATDQNGCTAAGQVTVTPLDIPILDFGTSQYLQCANEAIQLNTNTDPSFTYNWSSSDPSVSLNASEATPSVLVSTTTTFTVTVTDQNGCSGTGSINVLPVDGPEIDLVNSTVQCLGDSIELNPNFSSDLNYQWSSEPDGILTDPMDPNPTVSLSEFTVFNVTVTDNINPQCITESFVNVLVPDDPTLDVTPVEALVLCEGESQAYTASSDGIIIVWINAEGDTVNVGETFEIGFEEVGEYMVVTSNLFGCSQSQTIVLTAAEIEAVEITSSLGTNVFCADEQIILTASTQIIELVEFEWQDSNGNIIGTESELAVNPSGTTTYNFMGVSSDGCPIEGSYTLTESELDLVLSGPEEICLYDQAEINAEILTGENVSLEWQPTNSIIGSNTGTTILVEPGSTTTYVVTATNEDGCIITESITLNVLTVGLVTIEADPQDVFFGQSSDLSVTPNLPGYTYEWEPEDEFDDPNSPNPTVTPAEPGNQVYTVTVTNLDGCQEVASITLAVADTPCVAENFHVPNMFTPNGDSHNDEFQVFTNAVDGVRIFVFDRWGEKVFDSQEAGRMSWDGTYNGSSLNPDVYGYCVQVTCSEGENFTKTGNLSLVK